MPTNRVGQHLTVPLGQDGPHTRRSNTSGLFDREHGGRGRRPGAARPARGWDRFRMGYAQKHG